MIICDKVMARGVSYKPKHESAKGALPDGVLEVRVMLESGAMTNVEHEFCVVTSRDSVWGLTVNGHIYFGILAEPEKTPLLGGGHPPLVDNQQP